MGSSKKVTIGYKYYLGLHFSVCHGPVDAVKKISVGDRVAWDDGALGSGSIFINAPDLFGGETKEGGIQGPAWLAFGESTQTENSYLQEQLGSDIPAFRGVLTIVYSGLVSAMTPYIKPWAFRVTRILSGWKNGAAWYPTKAAIGDDMNPAHIIYQCLTDVEWGMGYPSSALDDVVFKAAADVLYGESFGLSIYWSESQTIRDFINTVLEHISGVLVVSRKTGLFEIRLIRNNYALGSLPVIDPSNARLELWQKASWGEAANEITASYTDSQTGETRNVTVQDLASIVGQGSVVTRSVNYSGITQDSLAQRVALRDLQIASTPLTKATVSVNRSGYDWLPGDVLRLTWPKLGIDGAYRVLAINQGTIEDGTIRIDLIEDVFGIPESSYTSQQSPGWTEPSNAPQPVVLAYNTELPYYDLARGLSPGDLAVLQPEECYIVTYAAAPTSDCADYNLWTAPVPESVVEQGTGSHVFVTTLSTALAVETFSTVATGGLVSLAVDPQTLIGTYLVVNGECMRIDSVDILIGSMDVARGCLDTLPIEHSAGSLVWIPSENYGQDGVPYLLNETIAIKHQVTTGSGVLALPAATEFTVLMRERQARPYPPGNFRLDGARYPAALVLGATLLIEWSHRDRLTQTADIIDQETGDVGPELGVTYELRIYADSALDDSVSNLTGNSYIYTVPAPAPAAIRVELWSVRAGFEAWMFHDWTFSAS